MPQRALAILLLLSIAVCNRPARAEGAQPPPGPKKAVVFTLASEIVEQDVDDEFRIPFFGADNRQIGVRQLTKRLNAAAASPEVSGVLLIVGKPGVRWEHLPELRAAILKIKASGKPVIATAEELDTLPYLLASAADKVYLNPDGVLMLAGIRARQWYLKGTLDKLGLAADMLHVGAYKGAAEPLMLDHPSKESSEMMNWLLDDWYAQLCEQAGQARGKNAAAGKAWIENGPYTANQALQTGLIDGVKTRAEALEEFRQLTKMKEGETFEMKFGVKKEQAIDFGNPFALFQIFAQLMKPEKTAAAAKPCVGVLYAEGEIASGKSEEGGIGSDMLVNEIEKARKNANIKAVVLRIDSPGGSALASECIYQALLKLKAEKPLIVSMGTLTASGGYYIACPADRIFAHPSSLVGSIGVVGGKIVTKGLTDLIGMTSATYTRGGERAGIMDTATPFSPAEKSWFMSMVNETYELFAKHVKDGRGEKIKDFDKISGGRVFTGRQGLANGLVDELGGLDAAVAYAAKKAGLADFEMKVLNQRANPTLQLLRGLSGGGESEFTPPTRTALPALPPRLREKVKLALNALALIDKPAAAVLARQARAIRLLSTQRPLLLMPFEITKE